MQRNIFENWTCGIISEADVFKFDITHASNENGRTGLIGDLGVLAQYAEHSFNINQALFDFAVGRSNEVQRHVQLDH